MIDYEKLIMTDFFLFDNKFICYLLYLCARDLNHLNISVKFERTVKFEIIIFIAISIILHILYLYKKQKNKISYIIKINIIQNRENY